MSLNLNKKKPRSNHFGFRQNLALSGKWKPRSYFSINEKTSFLGKILYPSVFHFRSPAYNSKFSFRRSIFSGRLVWRMYGRRFLPRWSYMPFGSFLRAHYFSKIRRIILRSSVKKIYRRRSRFFKKKHIIPMHLNGFSMVSRTPRFLWKSIDQKICFWLYVQLKTFGFKRKKYRFSSKWKRRKWRLRNRNRKMKLRLNQRGDKFSLFSKAKFVEKLKKTKKTPLTKQMLWCFS